MTGDIKNFYLNTPLKRMEYIKIELTDIPQEVIQEYKLKDMSSKDGSIYMEVSKGMYGLPQAGIMANKKLEKILSR